MCVFEFQELDGEDEKEAHTKSEQNKIRCI